MKKPNVTFTVQPQQGEAVTYQLLAAATSKDEVQAQIALLIDIHNLETGRIVLTSVDLTVFFPNGQPVHMDNPVSTPIEPGKFATWHTRAYTTKKEDTGLPEDVSINHNLITHPTANILNVSLKFRDFDEPVNKLFALRPHESPTPAKAYVFPAKGTDLLEGECWRGAGARHEESEDGWQLFALDVVVSSWEASSKSWTDLTPVDERDPETTKNTDSRVWRKQVYAMADGEVLAARWDFPENSFPCPIDELSQEVKDLMGTLGDGNGNFIQIVTGDEVHLYAHFQPHSIPHNLRTAGASVKQGDLLGRVGNSGNSSGPHLHFGIKKKLRLLLNDHPKLILRPMPFTDMYSINSLAAANGIRDRDPWFRHTGHGLSVADWPVMCLISFNPGWEPRGGTLTSGPDVCSWKSGRLDVFARGLDNALWHVWFDDGWHEWEQRGADQITSDPAAVSWGHNRIDVFVRMNDNALHHKWWDGSRWSGYESRGGTITSGPAVCSWASGRLDVFARGTDNTLYHLWFDGKWHDWEQLDATPVTSDPAAVSWGPNRIDVFVRGSDNSLLHKLWNGHHWTPYESLGGTITSGPTACSWTLGRLDVFARGADNTLYQLSFDGEWHNWTQLGVYQIDSDPAAVSWGVGRIDVFARGTGKGLHHKWWNGHWRP